MLEKVKDEVQVEVMPHTYSFGNQGMTVGRIKNKVDEYLFIGYDRNQRPSS